MEPWRKLLVEHAPILAIVLAYCLFTAGLGRVTGLEVVRVVVVDGTFAELVLDMALLALLLRTLPHVVRLGRGLTDLATAARAYRSANLTVERLGGLAICAAFVVPFFSAFTSLKRSLIHLRGLTWDATFADWDRALHLGRHPWEWLHPLLGHPPITRALDLAYMLWFVALVGAPILVAASTRRALRMQFLLTVVLCYVVLGSFVAFALPCADPCYFAAVAPGRPDPYRPLMDYLYAVNADTPLWAIKNQEALWASRDTLEWQPFGGVAGMPSLHTAYATCLMLLSWRHGRAAAAIGTAYCAMIALGSVHLAWHYAVDTWFSLLAVPLLWFGAGRFVAWWGIADPPDASRGGAS